MQLEDGSILKNFIETTKAMDPHERGLQLEKVGEIATVHEEVANEGQTAAPNRDESIITHFVTFVHKDGHLFELDGRRAVPAVNHGPTTPENLLKVRNISMSHFSFSNSFL